jgi:hypothetical protein
MIITERHVAKAGAERPKHASLNEAIIAGVALAL